MVNYTLQNLTSVIKKCCKVVDGNSPSNRYMFDVDIVKLENILKQKNTNLHTLALDKNIKSDVVDLKDILLVTEYIHDEKNINIVFDGNSTIAQFSLFSMENANGEVILSTVNNDGVEEALSSKDIFNKCNVDVDEEFVKKIINTLPCYRVIVTRSFFPEYDKFDYRVYIRSNFEMVAYQKYIKDGNETEIEITE